MSDELLIRTLLWQNGVYCGLLAGAARTLEMNASEEECAEMAEEIRTVMRRPLPPFLGPSLPLAKA